MSNKFTLKSKLNLFEGFFEDLKHFKKSNSNNTELNKYKKLKNPSATNQTI